MARKYASRCATVLALSLLLGSWLYVSRASADITNLTVNPIASVTQVGALSVSGSFNTGLNDTVQSVTGTLTGTNTATGQAITPINVPLNFTETTQPGDTVRTFTFSSAAIPGDLLLLGPGTYSLAVAVTVNVPDGMGGTTPQTQTVNAPVTVTIPDAATLVQVVQAMINHTPAFITRAQKSFLKQAQSAANAPNAHALCGKLKAFANHVRAQRGKAITTAAADKLLKDAQTLIANCQHHGRP